MLKGILYIWFIWTLVFVLVRLTGDPTHWILPEGAQQEAIDKLRATLGLDLPLHEQYLHSFTSIFKGAMGESYFDRRDVTSLYAERLASTLQLGLPAFLLSVVLGVLLGVLAAVKHNTAFDRVVSGFTTVAYTVPGFAFGIILILIFSLWLKILPSGGVGTLRHFILPTVAMTVAPTAVIARLTRSSMLDTMGKEYLDGARMKGLKETAVVWRHALRASLIPVVTTVGVQLGTIIGGAVVVETVFAWPGIGMLIINATKQRDFPTIQYGVLLISSLVTLANIVVDVSYGFLDPRIRESFK